MDLYLMGDFLADGQVLTFRRATNVDPLDVSSFKGRSTHESVLEVFNTAGACTYYRMRILENNFYINYVKKFFFAFVILGLSFSIQAQDHKRISIIQDSLKLDLPDTFDIRLLTELS